MEGNILHKFPWSNSENGRTYVHIHAEMDMEWLPVTDALNVRTGLYISCSIQEISISCRVSQFLDFLAFWLHLINIY